MPEASIQQDRSTVLDRLIDEYRFGSPADKLMTWIGLASMPLGASATKLPATAQKGLAGMLKNYSPKIVSDGSYARELGREIAEEVAVNNAPEARPSEIAHNPVLSEGNGLVDLGHGVLAETLPDGSTVTYRGISGEDLVNARRDVRQSPSPEENEFLNIMSKLGGLVNGGRNVPSSPPTLPSSEYIDSSGQRQYMLTGLGIRG